MKQLLDSVDSLFDFQKSLLYQHLEFKKPESSFTEDLIGKLLEGFRNEKDFGYMKGHEEWEKMCVESVQIIMIKVAGAVIPIDESSMFWEIMI